MYIPDGLINVGPCKPRKCVMQLSDEFRSVIFGHAHECSAHDNELNLRDDEFDG